ncbi:MAG TPA: M2 family metallopeptidase [Verrucomicrobiae bacterium]|nr:M2 family metallopeptidase [Verrucomicrobiae bacterium]
MMKLSWPLVVRVALPSVVAAGALMMLHAKISAAPAGAVGAPPTVEEARHFIEGAEARLLDLWIKDQRAQWVHENFITDDTEQMAADADAAVAAATSELAARARRFDGLKLPPDVARKFMLLKLSVAIPAPRDPKLAAELTKINASLDGDYGRGKWCPDGSSGKCLDISDVNRVFATSRDPNELKRTWVGWHAVGAPMRQRYSRMVVLANQGAKEIGFDDVGAMWRSNYDMTPDQFAAEVDRLWQQVRPLYVSLHAYVRWKLEEKYGPDAVREGAPIPAHLLGNVWAQDWTNIYPLVAPSNSDPGYDLTQILKSRKETSVSMTHTAEKFFMSLGFPALPQTFWERSLFTKPQDRDVVCHASAWDVDFVDDLRVKVCLEPNAEDFQTIHHELGHNFYQRAYDKQPPFFRDSANDGFHEAIGDTIALSVTPEYLKQIGLLESVPPPAADIGLLLNRALEKVSFLPFGLMIDKWRWGVFSGKIPPSEYNKAWWDLRRQYQGVAPPVDRTEMDFDPGAKFHIPGNVPYARYFLSFVLQFQFHRALCREAGYTGALNRCSIYGNKAAGAKLAKMLEMGKSRPWPEALEAMTGEKDIDATAILDYFAPLKQWLDEQNKGHKVGW